MLNEIKKDKIKHKLMFPLYYEKNPILYDFAHTYQVFSKFIGCDINFWDLFLTNPWLCYYTSFKTIQTSQYKLCDNNDKMDSRKFEKYYYQIKKPPTYPWLILLFELIAYLISQLNHCLLRMTKKPV